MPIGRPRRYPDSAARQRAYRQRHAAASSPEEALIHACAVPDPDETWAQFVARMALTLSAAACRRDALEWTTARLLVAAARAALVHPDRPHGRTEQISRRLLADLRQCWKQMGTPHPKPTWLKQALQTARVFPDLFPEQAPPQQQDQAGAA